MTRTAIISVDGHVKASRAIYRDYIEQRYHAEYDDEVRRKEEANVPDAGNLHPDFPWSSQWDSRARLEQLESVGCVAEVLFPNGQPFQLNPFDDFAQSPNPELSAAGRRAYNRWLVDFCADVPGRRSGQMVMSFSDVDDAVQDVHWAKEQGLGGIMLPALTPGGTFFFDPVLDPIWAACQETGLPVTQHGGAGIPAYSPPGFPAILTLAIENGFYSGRSLWQLILGGVFDRFPDLRVAWVETTLHFLAAGMGMIDMILGLSENDWATFASLIGRDTKLIDRPVSEYMGTNVFIGVSPFRAEQMSLDQLLGRDADGTRLSGFHFGSGAVMYGIDYPHFESIFNANDRELARLASSPIVDDDDLHAILFDNAASVFAFDVDGLRPHVERVGFDADELRAGAPVS
jgi:predicted TIM-barrel fold metal-dependent hydrolase